MVLDSKFEIKPSKLGRNQPEWWGGYIAKFKLVQKELYDELGADIEALRRRAEESGPAHKRVYTIDISQNEFCEGKVKREVDDYVVYAYSLEMIAAEKLRAICQQMSDYIFGRIKKPRARDFYDIYQIISEHGIDLTTKENLSILAAIFAAKKVPLNLLGEIQKQRNFHAPDWPSVETSISGKHETFDHYFDSVSKLASRLETLGKK